MLDFHLGKGYHGLQVLAELLEQVVGGAMLADLAWARDAARAAVGDREWLTVDVGHTSVEVMVTLHAQVHGRRRNWAAVRVQAWDGEEDLGLYVTRQSATITRVLALKLLERGQ